MRAGQLRESVTIQVRALADADSYGEQAEAWSDVETVRAEITQLGGQERWRQKTIMPEATHEVLMRYTANMTHDKRLLWDSRYLYPMSVIVGAKQSDIRCLCKEQL